MGIVPIGAPWPEVTGAENSEVGEVIFAMSVVRFGGTRIGGTAGMMLARLADEPLAGLVAYSDGCDAKLSRSIAPAATMTKRPAATATDAASRCRMISR